MTADLEKPTPAPDAPRRLPMTPRLIIGLFIVAVGTVLVFDRLDLMNAATVLRFWPVAVIAIGGVLLAQATEAAGRLNGTVVIVVGTYLLLYSLGVVQVGFWRLFWPFVLILIGSQMVLHALRPRLSQRNGTESADRISIVSVMSGVKRASSSARFRGGEISAFMGGGQLDLRLATIPPGEDATIDAYMMMSGFEIIVPRGWTVSTPVIPIMGGVEDKRLPPLGTEIEPQPGGPAPPRLIIRGSIIMAGIVIKN